MHHEVTLSFPSNPPASKVAVPAAVESMRNSYRRRLESLRMSGVVVGERWEAEYGNDPTDSDSTHFYVWFRLITPAPSTILAEGVTR
jgi:hypothetical protein